MSALSEYVDYQLRSVAFWERMTTDMPYLENPYSKPFIRVRFPVGYFPQLYHDTVHKDFLDGPETPYYRSTFFHPLRRAVWIAQGRRKHGISAAVDF